MNGCATCGEPTQIVEQSGGIEEGHFKEKYECVNGHIGKVIGEASNPPQEWSRLGQVFNA